MRRRRPGLTHLPFEVCLEIVVVQQHEIGAGAGLSTHCEGVQVHVGQVVGPGEAGIAGVAANADVGHPVVERQTVERRVRFDEPPVRLRR